MSSVASGTTEGLKLVQDDEAQVRAHLAKLCGAKRYARSPERLDTRAGHYDRKLHTKAGEITLNVPRLRSLPFETHIVERYRRRESSVE